MSDDQSRAQSSSERSASNIAVTAVSFISGVLAIILGIIQLVSSTHSRRSIGILIIGVSLALLAGLLWQQSRVRDLLRKAAHTRVPVSFVALLVLLLAGVGLIVVPSSGPASDPAAHSTSTSPPPGSPTTAPPTSTPPTDSPEPTTSSTGSPSPSTTSAAPTTAPAPQPAQNQCPDTLSVPPSPPTPTFLISLKVTCPVTPGNQLALVAEIQNSDGHGNTEFYLVTKWAIRTNIVEAQTFQSHVTAGPQRTYYVISVTPDQLSQIMNGGNTLSDGGHYSLLGAAVVSNRQPNQVK